MKKSTTSGRKGLHAISDTTRNLWYQVIRKYGNHSYRLAVNGLDEVILSKGYTETIAKGNREAQKVLRDLLKN